VLTSEATIRLKENLKTAATTVVWCEKLKKTHLRRFLIAGLTKPLFDRRRSLAAPQSGLRCCAAGFSWGRKLLIVEETNFIVL